MLYFISDGEFTKIGYTRGTSKNNLDQRLSALQTSNAKEFKNLIEDLLKLNRRLSKDYHSSGLSLLTGVIRDLTK